MPPDAALTSIEADVLAACELIQAANQYPTYAAIRTELRLTHGRCHVGEIRDDLVRRGLLKLEPRPRPGPLVSPAGLMLRARQEQRVALAVPYEPMKPSDEYLFANECDTVRRVNRWARRVARCRSLADASQTEEDRP